MTVPISDIFSFYLGVIFLWIGINWLYRDFAVDYFRQKMFTLRDSMFDAASEGLINFDHPAYTMLRRTMNGVLRFSHKISLFSFIVYGFMEKKSKKGTRNNNFQEQWEKAIISLDDDTRKKLEFFRLRMAVLMVFQAILSSPIILVFIIVPSIILVIPAIILWQTKNKIVIYFTGKLEREINSIESAALVYGSSAN